MDAYVDVVSVELRELVYRESLAKQGSSGGAQKPKPGSSHDLYFSKPQPAADPDNSMSIDVDANAEVAGPGVEPVVSAPKDTNWAPVTAFFIGISLATAWLAMSVSVLKFTAWFGADIFYQMQFYYNAPILVMVLFFKAMDSPFSRWFGSKMFIAIFTFIGLGGNTAMMFLWPIYEFEPPFDRQKRFRVNYLSACIGVSSALGYCCLLILVRSLSKATNVAFRAGFASSALAVGAMMILTKWSLPTQESWSEIWFWRTSGIVSAVGIILSIILLRTKEARVAMKEKSVELAVEHTNNQLRRADERSALRAGQRVGIVRLFGLVWPAMFCIIISFASTMFVFCLLPILPLCDPLAKPVLVLMAMVADMLGHGIAALSDKGFLPFSITTQRGLWPLALFRGAFAVGMIWFLLDPLFVDDRWVVLIILCFVMMGGFLTSYVYKVAADSVRIADRSNVVGMISISTFLGMYGAFIVTYGMYERLWNDRNMLKFATECA